LPAARLMPHPTFPMPAAPHRGATIIPTHTHGAAVIRGTKGPAPLRSVCAHAVVGLLERVVPSAGPAASRDMREASQTRATRCARNSDNLQGQ
jgi:hypothetical protein